MNTKDNLYSHLKGLPFNGLDNMDKYTAQYLSTCFDLKRNTASMYLNQLVDDNKVIKVNTRPVIFIDKNRFNYQQNIPIYKNIEELKTNIIEDINTQIESGDSLSSLIGAKLSLRPSVEQIRTSLLYPNGGLPIILNGPTGSGKSYTAKLMSKFCKNKGLIAEDAPFISLNCAQYANNPELLTSTLFGYVKGAFTGADINKKGLFEEADQGILFLDEVHRLPAEGQEKLFTYLDSGKIYRLGDNSEGKKVSVRLIFATTENLDDLFLDTFMRRIPIKVNIPDLSERTKEEKEKFMYKFLIDEAIALDREIILSKAIKNDITSISWTRFKRIS